MPASASIASAALDRPSLTPREGDMVSGKYRLLRPLGAGGMGLVYEAFHLRLRRRVALKFLRPSVLGNPESVERFEREARAAVRLQGPHVAHVLDVDSDSEGRPFMVMELLEGRDIEAELRERGPLPIETAVDWVLQACAGMAEAHAEGIIHRDLKPSNLFLAQERDCQRVKVLDFGISKLALDAEPSVTTSTLTIGTPLYMSPEQVRASRDLDARTDVWSLGVILYELLAGVPPFHGATTAAIAAIVADRAPDLRLVRPDVPVELERVIRKALAKSPSQRHDAVEALAAALLPFAPVDSVASRDWGSSASPSSARVCSTALSARLHGLIPTAPASGTRITRGVSARHPTSPARSDLGLVREAAWTFAGAVALGIALATVTSFAAGRVEGHVARTAAATGMPQASVAAAR